DFIMTKRFLGAVALAGLVALAMQNVRAQDDSTAGAGGEAAADAGDPVVAIVNGQELRRSDVVASARTLPPQYQQQVEQLFPALVERLIDLNLLGAEAQKQGLSTDEEVEQLVAEYREQAMREVMIDRFLRDTVTDEKIQARYDEL